MNRARSNTPSSDDYQQATRSWLSNKLVKRLMASSSITDQELREGSTQAARELLFRLSSVLGTVAPLIMAFLYIVEREKFLGTVYSILACFMMIHSILLFSTNARLISPLTILLVSLGLYVGAMFWGQDYFIYWGYAFSGSFYLFLEKKQALPGMLFVIIVVSTTSFYVLPVVQALHFSGSLLLSLCFVELLCSMLYHQEERLRSLATADPLTNAFNRRVLMDSLEQAVTLYTRLGTPSTIVITEIDNLDEFKDKFGHHEAEVALINLVAILNELIGESDKICRYTGEELGIVLTGTGLEQAVDMAESFREAARMGNISVHQELTLSCGIAEVHLGDNTLSWLKRGIIALNNARDAGGNQVAVST